MSDCCVSDILFRVERSGRRRIQGSEMGTLEMEKGFEAGDESDRIGLLPDCILHHILSYLPTKESVATCVLSKRWRYLWTSVPTVDFDDSILYSSRLDLWYQINVESFMNFVEKVLLQRDATNMNRFRLSCRVCFNASHINEWIVAAMKHNIQELILCLFVEEPFVLPGCVFDSKMLTVMKLEMNCTLQLPPRISFPFLRKLQLCLVTFPNDTMMQSLFSGCPSLEELAVLDCEWVNLKSISITIPSLKILIIDDLPFCSVDDLRGCDIRIDARNLIFFKYSGYLSNVINVFDLSSSALALIHIPNLCGTQLKIACRTLKLFRGLKNVSSLRISSGTIESLFLAENSADYIPIFENMTLLELEGEFNKTSLLLLIKFLQFLPYLEHFRFCEGIVCHQDMDFTVNLTPKCNLGRLRKIDYRNFDGTQIEIWFLRFLLKNAVALEKMRLFWSKKSFLDPKSREEIVNQLQSDPRGSENCALIFA
ncbi:F-box/LRR-repeat protein At3g58900-like isoform X1 [Andrographis paniculata]|uniref:F-box/LRR-repeat protein At3g58900-like isoform X1 n=1 Tax=Andrographis paniculata TaxID=175694 RepID=UPI0021E7D12B|nr:F-box/LRR-repeat protein At3g58900-like isoform X1 [Andrographis paniculata]